ncbi:MAG: 16S rRNA (adenine(1518)-N(6)/adenine(1519)-N(6))-dimethyltransferase RsmA [Gammaproteobacteria bacterium]|nr:16S rRNA (adenine(1518)-N(6)/adenine(1519)-N(6))-dimethyltransferase RsmA [Gammaproteobacteria bacterium]
MIPPPPKKKSLGQHFLHDQNIINQIIKLVAPKPSDNLIEIGPGAGALTTKLLPLVESLDVIEFDQRIIPTLEKNCSYSPKLHIYNKDVLKFDFSQLSPPLRLVGNLPYNISTPLLFYLLKNINMIKDMYFMLQKEVAERIAAPPGSKTYGRLGVMLQYYCETNLLLHIGSGAFSPPPKVSSAFIRLTPRKNHKIIALDKEKFSEIVRFAFGQRRKTIANSLKKLISASQLEEIGINPISRPEQLSVDEFVLISNKIS